MAVTYAKHMHGDPIMVDHTPGSAVSAGDVIVTNDSVRIAHNDIAANVKGALAAFGGVYELPKTAGGSTAIADDKLVYWDATNHVITTTVGSNKKLGFTVGASVDADTKQRVLHFKF